MADYPVKDVLGNTIIANAYDPAWRKPARPDLSKHYPVKTVTGVLLISVPYATWADLWVLVNDATISTATGWTSLVLQNAGSAIDFTPDPDRAGKNLIRFTAGPTVAGVKGKAHGLLRPPLMTYALGVIHVKFKLRLPSASLASWDGQKLIDFENNTVLNAGTRMMIKDVSGQRRLVLERSKLLPGYANLEPMFMHFLDLDHTYDVQVALTLGDDATGRWQVWIDGLAVADAVGATVLTQDMWNTLVSGVYTNTITTGVTSLQIGNTANGSTTDASLIDMTEIEYYLEGPTGSTPFVGRGVYFDGADALSNAASTLVAGNQGMLSLWFRHEDTTWDAATRGILQFRTGSTDRLYIITSTLGRLTIRVYNDTTTDGRSIYAAAGNVAFVPGKWYNLIVTWSGTRTDMYVNGVLSSSIAFTSLDMNGQTLSTLILGTYTSGVGWKGCLAHVWVSTSQTLDMSVPANVAKFYNAGNPVDLGANGQLPTGVAPEFYFDGGVADWANKGTGPALTWTGAVAAMTDPALVAA